MRAIIIWMTGLLLAVAGFSTPITVNNPSFETLPAGGLTLGCGTDCLFSNVAIPGWTNATGSSGQIQPGPGQFSSLPDGPTSAWSNGPTISQTVDVTVEEGLTYILMVDLGFRLDTPFAASADLLVGSSMIVPATGVTPTAGTWSTFTAEFTGTAADAGDTITIQLNSSGAQANFDNVRLDAVPEPAFLGEIGFLLVGLAAFARRRRIA